MQEVRPRDGLKTDPLLFLIPLILSVIGVVMITSATSYSSLERYGSPWVLGLKQLKWLSVSLAAMVMVYSVPLHMWRKIAPVLWMLALAATWATLFPGIGRSVGGAKRWLSIGGFSFQPLEALAPVFSIYLAFIMSEKSSEGRAFLRCLTVAAFSALPLFFQPNAGGVLLIFTLAMGIYVINHGWRYPILAGGIMVAAFLWLTIAEEYRRRRWVAFLDPWGDPLDKGFQIIQGLIAFANGGFWGVGLGRGLQKLQYLPAMHTDYILAIVGEEAGLIGTMSLILVYALFSWRSYSLWTALDDPSMKSLLWGLVLSMLLPLFINLAGVLKMAPLSGMPLPFLSYGGSSLLFMWMRVGIMLKISSQCKRAGGRLI